MAEAQGHALLDDGDAMRQLRGGGERTDDASGLEWGGECDLAEREEDVDAMVEAGSLDHEQVHELEVKRWGPSGVPPKGVERSNDDSTISKKIKSAVTDTDTSIKVDWENKPGVSNLLSIHSSLSGESTISLEERFSGAGYGVLKSEVADVVISKLGPIRDRANELMSDPTELDKLLAQGAEKAKTVAEQTLSDVYDRVGFIRAN